MEVIGVEHRWWYYLWLKNSTESLCEPWAWEFKKDKWNYPSSNQQQNCICNFVGAHFLIAPDGLIHQTARLDRVCHHVGMIGSKCFDMHVCAPDENKAIKTLFAAPGSVEQHRMALHLHESNKAPKDRYPNNFDSIGIEIASESKDDIYVPPTSWQNMASTWLVGELLAAFHLKRIAVYRHPQVSYKQATEASQVKY